MIKRVVEPKDLADEFSSSVTCYSRGPITSLRITRLMINNRWKALWKCSNRARLTGSGWYRIPGSMKPYWEAAFVSCHFTKLRCHPEVDELNVHFEGTLLSFDALTKHLSTFTTPELSRPLFSAPSLASWPRTRKPQPRQLQRQHERDR